MNLEIDSSLRLEPETFKKRVNELFSNNEMKSSIIENNYKEDGEYDIIGS